MGEKSKKVSIAVISTILAIVLTLGSTMAWQSISQIARNERLFTASLGGRLHDDFDGKNKDVYVENYGDQPIITRVMLKEFLEYGPDAGQPSGVDRVPVDPDTAMQAPEKWKIHKPTGEDLTVCDSKVHAHLKYKFGGQTTYLPTFNMNQDSLAPDINGTFKKNFEDYVNYAEKADPVTGNEVYDKDKNNDDEGAASQEGVNITTKKNVSHTPTKTLEGTVISMEAWLANPKPGPYWVYDTDGWAYWAQPIEPKTATGLLLDEVTVTNAPGENFYYAIDVICQCTTMEDLGKNHENGFYNVAKGPAPSENAEKLLTAIGGSSKPLVAKSEVLKREQPDTGAGDPTLTIELDGIEFYVLEVQGNKALILSKYGLENRAFNASSKASSEPGNNQWKNSDLQNYLNGEWLNDKPILSKIAVATTLNTRAEYNSKEFVTTSDKVFVLSEADLTGNPKATSSGNYEAEAKDYTLGVAKVVPTSLRPCRDLYGNHCYSWLRSPTYYSNYAALTGYNSTSASYAGVSSSYFVRPALMIDLDKLSPPEVAAMLGGLE